jgi:hypothetical protein
LQDLGSSNGTLLYLQKPLKLSPAQKSVLRLGRSNIVFEVKKNFSLGSFGCVPCGGDFSSAAADVYQASCSASADDLLALMSKSVPASSSSSAQVRASVYSRDGSESGGEGRSSVMIPILESMDVTSFPAHNVNPSSAASSADVQPAPLRSDRSVGSSTVEDLGSLASCPVDGSTRRVSSIHPPAPATAVTDDPPAPSAVVHSVPADETAVPI